MYKFYLLCTLIISVLYTIKSDQVFHYKSENYDDEKQNFPHRTHEDERSAKRLNNNFIQELNSNHMDDAEERPDDMHSISGQGKSSTFNKSSSFNSNRNLINDNNTTNLLKRVLNKIRNSSEDSDDTDERTTKSPPFSPRRDSVDKRPAYSDVNRNFYEETDERTTKSYGQQTNSTAKILPTSFTNREPFDETDESTTHAFSSRQKNATVRKPPQSDTIGNSNQENDGRTTKSHPSSPRRDSFDKRPAYSDVNQETDEMTINSYKQEKNSTLRTSQPSVGNREAKEKTDERTSKPYPSTVRIPPPSVMDSASGKSTLRVCEIKYAEYIQRIFPQESDTARDANDEEFNGRVLAAPGEYPHMSALGFRSSDGKLDYKCGGSLISENFVITAAHCTNFTGLAPTKVRIGDLNLMVEESYLEPQIRDIKKIYVHPKYKTTSYYNDIALLELETEVRLTEFVRPIRLWTQETLPFSTAYAMGYGSTEFAREQTNRLTNLNMTIVPNEECNQEMPKLPQTDRGILPSQICARDYALNRDTCQGDSGGPLQLNIRGRRSQNRLHYQLIGITSYGLHCRSGYPSIFTRVCYYLDWIERIVWKDYFN